MGLAGCANKAVPADYFRKLRLIQQAAVWLIKILALIMGPGNVAGILVDLGTPWFLAVVPAGILVFFSLRENVSEVVPPSPIQDPTVYQSAWREYWRLRGVYKRSALGFVATLALVVVASLTGEKLAPSLQNGLFAACLAALFVSIVVMSFHQWKWLHWRCPRCGHSFHGVWGRLRLPKKCANCGLPREEQGAIRTTTSESSLNS